MARTRQPGDWARDLEAARPGEQTVRRALAEHPEITHLSDYTGEMDDLDFDFRFQGERVRVDVKEKIQSLSQEFSQIWPEVPESDLFVLDETSFRALLWAEGLGYLLVRDRPAARWHVLGPWELCLGPRRRFERREDRGAGEFLKGKMLLDLRTAAETTSDLSVDSLLRVVRASRAALRQVRALPVGRSGSLPIIPRPAARPAARPPQRPPSPEPAAAVVDVDLRWAGLDPALVCAIKATWGWDAPTAIQAEAFPPVLAGANVLILAPTASGKTEAALLPLLDIHHQAGWEAPSILMISPMKALLDDQLIRYRKAAALTGATVFAWHGDVGRSERDAFRDRPTDLLLTTPESLEKLLSRPSSDNRRLLGKVRAVIVDEVHSFAGTPRGAQLAALLERIDQRSNTDMQRIGLSATVGNPEQVLDWLSGGSQRVARVVRAGQPMKGEELSLISYETTDEAVAAIQEAVAGWRSLVFAPSRRRAEELANALGVAVHHSSVAVAGRSDAVDRLIDGSAACLVATSGLEMGIDIADLKLVVNDGAPSTPGSYLQRLGRAGRRDGNRRMVLTVGDADSLLLALAVVTRARRGQLDPIPPNRGARLVLGQQALALAFERNSVLRGDIHEYLRWSPLFARLSGDIDATINHLEATGWLASVGQHLVVGPMGQDRFGGRGFNDLLATFESSSGATVVGPGGMRIGTLDWGQVADASGEPRPTPVVLAGRSWAVVSIDRPAGTVSVAPATGGRAPSWRGPSLEVGRATWETAREILLDTEVPIAADDRARRWLAGQRGVWAPRLADPVRAESGATVVDDFTGVEVHRGLLAALGLVGSADGPTVTIDAPLPIVGAAAHRALDAWDATCQAEAVRQASKLAVRHPDLVAPAVMLAEAREFHVDRVGLRLALELIAGIGDR